MLDNCRVMADARAPIEVVGTGSFIPDYWHETYATADIMADVALTDTDPLTVMLWPPAICTLLVRPGTMPPVQFLGSAQAPAIPPPLYTIVVIVEPLTPV
jgi:hypothetical protein